MSKRICDACGLEKNVKGGKTCQTGHFICLKCVSIAAGFAKRSVCSVCPKPLR